MDVRLPDGTVIQGVPDGMSKADLIAKLKSNGYGTAVPEPANAAVNVGKELNSIPRQIGLTARYGLEGLGEAAQLVTEPLRYVTDRVTGSTGKTVPMGVLASKAADWVGLPSPQGADERTIATASKLVAGAGGTSAVAGLVQKATPLLQFAGTKAPPVLQGAGNKVAEFFSANPLQQISSAAGAGLAGGASREAGGSELEQGFAALAGGVAGGKAPDVANGAVNLAKRLFNAGMTPQQLDVKISTVLRQTGVDYSQVPERLKQTLREEMASSLNANRELNPAAVSRLLAFREAGITPTRGMISQNPVQITREQNLAKIGANSSDEGLQGLALVQNQNNNRLIGNLNTMGADRGNTLRAGETLTGSVLGRQAGLRGAEQSAWDAAKSSPGYRQPISAQAISDINGALGEQGLMPFMNPTISRYMEAFQKGQPFTPQDYRNLQSMLSREVAKGGNEGAAASLAARILRDAELQPAGFQNVGNLPVTQGMAAGMRGADNAATESIDLVNRARQATRSAYSYEDSSPLVRSVLADGRTSDPMRIAQSYIIGGTAREAEDLVRQVGPQGLPEIKNAILEHLKSKAVSGANDETAKFSQSAFNKALNDIGERKLATLFTPEEVAALRNNGRVAALMQSQPVGSAVNNSNSGALLLGKGLDFLGSSQLPFVSHGIESARINLGTRNALNVGSGLLAEQVQQPAWQRLAAPSVAIGGLLAAP